MRRHLGHFDTHSILLHTTHLISPKSKSAAVQAKSCPRKLPSTVSISLIFIRATVRGIRGPKIGVRGGRGAVGIKAGVWIAAALAGWCPDVTHSSRLPLAGFCAFLIYSVEFLGAEKRRSPWCQPPFLSPTSPAASRTATVVGTVFCTDMTVCTRKLQS